MASNARESLARALKAHALIFNRATLVDGIFPGPLIAAQKHWHGIFQNGTNYADGTSFVTQCPIAQNHSFLHSFSAPNQAGTYWYHSHYSVQQESIAQTLQTQGPLVIYDPHDPLAYMYDVDDASTVITLADWYHVVAPVLRHIIGISTNISLINGQGRYAGGPMSDLAVINVEQGKRYRMRLVAMSCDPNFQFSVDGHNLTIIEADGVLTEPLVADKPVDNYWIRSLPSSNLSSEGGINSAILRYKGATTADPTTVNTPSTNSLQEANLHALINPGAPGIPEYGKADINLNLAVTNVGGTFYVNNVTYQPPTVPVLLQILSGAQEPSQLLRNDSIIVLEANKVVELTLSTTGLGGPHPIHLHGSAGNTSAFNYVNPVRRDVVSAGSLGQQMVIRWTTDNSGPWFLHCGFAVVMAESPSDTRAHISPVPADWDQLCPIFDSLSPSQLGGGGFKSYEEAANITTLLFPTSSIH
ncbi:laccase [Suillus paluster]|uniref:laccase n=1 Tax=Suillus paluster TaxID=48578 RepID=UPI001B85C293|nr:laccase [Suillus paluster]KAG1732006.1 laccase [Suillus paluster]